MKFNVAVLLGLVLITSGSPQTEAREARLPSEANASSAPIPDLFAAMAAGDIEAKLIPQSSKTGTVIVTNATNKPLTIKLPDAFAGVPVLAQRRKHWQKSKPRRSRRRKARWARSSRNWLPFE